MWNLPKGKDFLPSIEIEDLQQMYRIEKKAKPKLRLLYAIHRKEGSSIDDIARHTSSKRRTVHDTIRRFVDRGIEAKDNKQKDGRPPKLNEKQRRKLIMKLERGPPHNRSGLWSTKEVRGLIRDDFGIEYTHSHVWDMLTTAGFSIQKPRMKHYLSPPKAEIEHFKKRLLCWQNITVKKGS